MLVSLSSIRTDGDTQSRAAISGDTVAEYAEAMRDGATFPPITLFHDGSSYWLADGFHRVVASRRSLIHDLRVLKPVCLTCYAKRAEQRVTYPVHQSRGLPPKSTRLVRL